MSESERLHVDLIRLEMSIGDNMQLLQVEILPGRGKFWHLRVTAKNSTGEIVTAQTDENSNEDYILALHELLDKLGFKPEDLQKHK